MTLLPPWPPWRTRGWSAAPVLLLAAMAGVHPWLEQTMVRHMGLELPALFLAGWFAAGSAGPGLGRAAVPWNAHGLPGMLFALCATGFWMVPAALDAAVLHAGMAMAKVASLVAAGLLLRISWASAGLVLQGFFVLNWFWMTLAAGMVYQEAPQQLCSVYLADQQAQAGRAVAAWAVAGLAAWLWQVGRAASRADEAARSGGAATTAAADPS